MRLAVDLGLIDQWHDMESASWLDFFSGRSLPPVLDSPCGGVLWLEDGKKVVDLFAGSASLPMVLIKPFPHKARHVAFSHFEKIKEFFSLDEAFDPSFSVPFNKDFHLKAFRIFRIEPSLKKNERAILPGEENLHKPYLILHPGSGSSRKNYSLSFYQRVIDVLPEYDFNHIRVILGPAEEKIRDEDFPALMVSRPREVSSLAQLLAKAHLYIGNDSGASHLAGILGTPTIAFYKSTDPDLWGVVGPRVIHLKAPEEKEAFGKLKESLYEIYFTKISQKAPTFSRG